MLGQWIKINREELGLSQQQLGELVGCSQQGIAHYEKESRTPSFEVMSDLVRLFDSEIKVTAEGIQSMPSGLKVNQQIEQLKELLWDILNHNRSLTPADERQQALRQTVEQSIQKRLKDLWAETLEPMSRYRLKGQNCSLKDLKAILKDGDQCQWIQFDLEQQAAAQIERFKELEDCFDPHEQGGFKGYALEILFNEEAVQASVSLSLYSPEKMIQESREWFWSIFTEIEGVVDQIHICLPMNEYSGAEAFQTLVQVCEEIVNESSFQDEFNQTKQFVLNQCLSI